MSTATKVKRTPGRRGVGARIFSRKAAKPAKAWAKPTLEEILKHPAFGIWKDKTISVEDEIRQWRKPRYGLG